MNPRTKKWTVELSRGGDQHKIINNHESEVYFFSTVESKQMTVVLKDKNGNTVLRVPREELKEEKKKLNLIDENGNVEKRDKGPGWQ